VVAGRGDGAENGVADIDCEHGACFAAEYIEVCNVETDVLTSNGGIKVMGHWHSLVVRLAIQTVGEIDAKLLGAIHLMTAFSTLMLLAEN
jgi:hypothetical protein